MEDFFLKFSRHFERRKMPKHWKESHGCLHGHHADADFRRKFTRAFRAKENQHLRSTIANGDVEQYELLCVEKRNVDWFFF
jgi:hypothetical protein